MTRYIALLSALSLASAFAVADDAKEKQTATPATKHQMEAAGFDTLDQDEDGHISKSEAEASPMVMKHFDEVDEDMDGYLSKAEFESYEWTDKKKSY
jgi:Ca2+-binding EF-hand superfamily protein